MLEISRTFEDPERLLTVLRLKGSIDSTTAPELKAAFIQLLDEGRRGVILDLTQVEYLSSAGWGVILGRLREFRNRGGDIYLVAMREPILSVFKLMGLDRVLNYFKSLDQVREELKLRPWTELAVGEVAQPITPPPKPRTLSEVIREVVKENPLWGVRQITRELLRASYGVSSVNTFRVYRELARLKMRTQRQRLLFSYRELKRELDGIKSRL